MNNDILITQHPAMDFILTHIFSIILFSGNGITLKHKTASLVALYPKGLPVQKSDCSWKKYRKHQNPCLITTAYSVQLLAKAANFTFEFPQIYKASSFASAIRAELANLSILQLDYCLESLESKPYSIELYTSLLEGCLAVSRLNDHKTDLKIKRLLDYDGAIDILYRKLALDTNLDSANTMELCRIANAFHQLINQVPSLPDTDIIAKTALELTHCRNLLGLFQRDRIHHRTAPLGWQFYCIASLLLSYTVYPIDKILEDAFSAFNHLYQLSWNSSLGFFSFGRNPYIKYTSFEIASIIKALYLLPSWVSEEEQLDQLDQILSNSYIPIISEAFFTGYHQSIHALYSHLMNKMSLPYEPAAQEHRIEACKAPVLPAAIHITRSPRIPGVQQNLENPQVRWVNHSPIQLRHPLELCICILDYLQTHYLRQNQVDKEDSPLNWLELLFSIICQHH